MRRRPALPWLLALALVIGSGAVESPATSLPPTAGEVGFEPGARGAPSIAVPGLAGATDALVSERASGPSGGGTSRQRWIRYDLADRPSLIARADVHARHPDHRASDALARGGAFSAPSTAPPALRSA